MAGQAHMRAGLSSARSTTYRVFLSSTSRDLAQYGEAVHRAIGKDNAGRIIIQLAVDDRVLETLMTFDAEAVEIEDGGDDEPDADDEDDGPPVALELARSKVVARRRALVSSRLVLV